MSEFFSIAIDGPSGAGKSTIARIVAETLGAQYVDTGAMYRTMALYMTANDCTSALSITAAVDRPNIEVRFIDGVQHMYLDGQDVTDRLRDEKVSQAASKVAVVPAVRYRLIEMQRALCATMSVVIDGRDIGTEVLPKATLKIYLDADREERARRRTRQDREAGMDVEFKKILEEIDLRDYRDKHREIGPLRKATDAVLVDSTNMTMNEVVERILALSREAIAK